MRIAGYVRESPGRSDPDSAFAQSERIRRWVLDTANEMIAICQDHHAATAPTDRPGFKALLDIARSGGADGVLVANLAALSPDKMTQEIMIQDLRTAGVTVIETEEKDIDELRGAEDDYARMRVRDVLSRISEYRSAFGLSGDVTPTVDASQAVPVEQAATTDVVVQLKAARAQSGGRVDG